MIQTKKEDALSALARIWNDKAAIKDDVISALEEIQEEIEERIASLLEEAA